jgi:uncharacterized membrane protein
VDGAALLRVATERDLLVRLRVRPGDYLVAGGSLCEAWPAARVEDGVQDRLAGSVVLGAQPTLEQDVRFAVEQLVEVAVRALSTGINDPFTALNCLDVLSAALSELAGRATPSPLRQDAEGTVRVIATPVTFVEILHESFHHFRTYAGGAPAVMLRLAEVAERLTPFLRRPADVRAVGEELRLIRLAARRALSPEDAQVVEERCGRALTGLGVAPRPAAVGPAAIGQAV